VIDSVFHLLRNRFQPVCGFRAEGIVAAVGASTCPDDAIAIGTAESAVNADFVNLAAKPLL
jgi:hypothetical protein